MKKTTFNKLGLVLLLALATSAAFAQSAPQIIEKADSKMRGNSNITEMTIQIIRPNWTREMKIKSWSLGTEYSISLVQAPAKDKGTVFLKRNRELWNWLPAIERTIKMPPSMLMQSWMGSDLSNDDLVKETSNKDDFSSKIIGEETIEGRKCWKIDMTPRPDAAVVWGKVVAWVDQKDYIYIKTEYYDEDEYLVNTMVGTDIKNMGGRIMATKMEVLPAEEPGNKTIMIFDKITFNTKIPQSYFTVQNMKRLR